MAAKKVFELKDKIAGWILVVVTLAAIFLGICIGNPKFLDTNYSFYFNEFLQSSNFSQLLEDNIHTFNYRVNGGTYNLGNPIAPINETVYGTNRGLRILPLLFFLTTLQKIFGPGWDRIYLTIILILPFIAYWWTIKFFEVKTSKTLLLISSLFYALNPWIFSRLFTGFWQLHIAYAGIPWVYFALTDLSNKLNKYKRAFIISVSIIVLSLIYQSQPHFLVMLSIPISIHYVSRIINKEKIEKRALLVSIFIITLGFLLINGYQLITSYFSEPFTITVANQFFSLGAVKFNGSGSTLASILRLFPQSPLHPDDPILKWEYLKFGFMALVGFILFYEYIKNKNSGKTYAFLLITLATFIFLGKGINPPFTNISKIIYLKIPIMHVFRDPSRFYAMIAFFGSLVILYSTRVKINRLKTIFIATWFLLSIFLMSKELGQKMGYQKIPYRRYQILSKINTGRLLFIPNNTSLKTFSWFDDGTDGLYNSPLEALVPIKANLANLSGTYDNYFSQLSYY